MTVPGLAIEPLVIADRAVLSFLFERLGPASRYGRFHAVKRRLQREDLDLLTAVDHWHAEALVAWSPVPRAPIGVARYIRGAEFDLAEVAFAVTDAWQRRGVGSALGAALREHALRAGIRRYSATVLAENRGALALARRLGDETRVTAGGHGVVEVQGTWAPQAASGVSGRTRCEPARPRSTRSCAGMR